MSCSRKDRMTGKQLYEANHLYSMNSNKYKNICKKTATSKHHPKQRRPLILTCKESPNFRRQMVLIMQISHPIYTNTTKGNNAKYNSNANIRHKLLARMRKFKPIVSKPLIFSFLLMKQNQHIKYSRF
jgi:hypothetical protein